MGLNIALVGVTIGAVIFAGSYSGKEILERPPEAGFPLISDAVLVVAGLRFIISGERHSGFVSLKILRVCDSLEVLWTNWRLEFKRP